MIYFRGAHRLRTRWSSAVFVGYASFEIDREQDRVGNSFREYFTRFMQRESIWLLIKYGSSENFIQQRASNSDEWEGSWRMRCFFFCQLSENIFLDEGRSTILITDPLTILNSTVSSSRLILVLLHYSFYLWMIFKVSNFFLYLYYPVIVFYIFPLKLKKYSLER